MQRRTTFSWHVIMFFWKSNCWFAVWAIGLIFGLWRGDFGAICAECPNLHTPKYEVENREELQRWEACWVLNSGDWKQWCSIEEAWPGGTFGLHV